MFSLTLMGVLSLDFKCSRRRACPKKHEEHRHSTCPWDACWCSLVLGKSDLKVVSKAGAWVFSVTVAANEVHHGADTDGNRCQPLAEPSCLTHPTKFTADSCRATWSALRHLCSTKPRSPSYSDTLCHCWSAWSVACWPAAGVMEQKATALCNSLSMCYTERRSYTGCLFGKKF